MEFYSIILLILAVPFVLPIAGWISAVRTRRRVRALESALEAQRETIERLEKRFAQLRREMRPPAEGETAPPAKPAIGPEAAPARMTERPSAPAAPVPEPPPVPAAPAPPTLPPPTPPPPVAPPSRPAAPPRVSSRDVEPVLRREPAVHPPPSPPEVPFDWESLVGVKLFSAIAGIALVLAAVFFLRYSIEHGWLQPPVRVLIGIAVAIALLVVCELKAARQYPATANALDAAAIAILFSTFFAAHALWDLIPGVVAFGLLSVVTALAVLLSIRRESLFIAVLGLLGGFATPALLSTGENRPIPLFAYLMLLNVGLAWVAYRQTWPVLTVLTVVLTTIYQWGWVLKFLAESDLPLAMGIFLVFPLATIAGLLLSRRKTAAAAPDRVFERTALIAAVLPLLFAVYVAAVPAYGAHPWLLFGFLLVLDAGLLAVAISRNEELLHAAGATVTLLAMAIWLANSYTSSGARPALLFSGVFALFFLAASPLAARLGRPFTGPGRRAAYAAPLLLFVPTVLVSIEPAFATPVLPLAAVLGLVLIVAWRAIADERGALYYVAAFFAVAAQATWSSSYLSVERLRMAVAIYAVFGVVAIAVPIAARRLGKPLRPGGGAGVVLLASLALLLFLAGASIAPAAIWALALLLAILNAGLFIESASGGLPLVSIAGSLLSWIVLANWWTRAGAAVGVLESLTVLMALALVTLGGHAWAYRQTTEFRAADPTRADAGADFAQGVYLGLIGHLFLLLVATNRAWSLPPWPVFGTLAVLTLAASGVSLVTKTTSLHAAAAIAAAVIVMVWAAVAGVPPWHVIALSASAVVSAYALSWIVVARRVQGEHTAARAAAAVLFIGEATACVVAAGQAPPFAPILTAHVANLSLLLALTRRQRWRRVALAAAFVSAAAVGQWRTIDPAMDWVRLLVIAVALYTVFIAYPLVLGRRAGREREPYLAAIVASAVLFFAARAALEGAGYGQVVGAVPVIEAGVLALLLRGLLRNEAPGERDLGRLALVAGAALAFVTVAIPVQLHHQWITIGWALEGAALAWLYRRVPHKGLLLASTALLAVVFVRLALNSAVFVYQPRGSMRILNWYLYAYAICAAALLLAAWWLSKTDEHVVPGMLRPSRLLSAGAAILLFILLNIEIADFYATEPTLTFHFGVSVSQDLTYTIGWLAFGIGLLAAGIFTRSHAARIAALALIAVTTFKCFLYDLASLGGLYRVASFVGLALSLALVSIALQKYVLAKPKGAAS
jgi:hypothetical protein